MSTWPAGVNEDYLLDSVNEETEDAVERTSFQEGPDNTRRKSSAVPRKISGVILMRADEYETFYTWFKNDLAMGALTFDWHLPGQSDTLQALMMPPKRSSATRVEDPNNPGQLIDLWRVMVAVEFQP